MDQRPTYAGIFCLYLPPAIASKAAQHRLSSVSAVAAVYFLPSIWTEHVIENQLFVSSVLCLQRDFLLLPRPFRVVLPALLHLENGEIKYYLT